MKLFWFARCGNCERNNSTEHEPVNQVQTVVNGQNISVSRRYKACMTKIKFMAYNHFELKNIKMVERQRQRSKIIQDDFFC